MVDIFLQFDIDIDNIDTSKYGDKKPFIAEKIGKPINKDEFDINGEFYKNNMIDLENIKINPINSDRVINIYFDKMNNDSFAIDPLLIPIKPIDINYNSSEILSKFMNAL